jgi:DNA ligase-associated metallophosphoesterase
MDQTVILSIRGQHIQLMSQRAAFWKEQHTLIVSDLHLGKAMAFRKAGIPIPEGAMDHDLRSLKKLIEETQAKRCVVVGDLIHSKSGISESVKQLFTNWLHSVACEIDLVIGNHDRSLINDLPNEWNLSMHLEKLLIPPFCFCHIPTLLEEYFVWSGHIHPEIVLKSDADRLRLRCFQVFDDQAVLPAFSSFVGGSYVHKNENNRIFAIADHQIIEI